MACSGQKIMHGAAGLLLAALVAGCATTASKMTVQYKPVVNATGGAGELYLAIAGEEPLLTSGSRKSLFSINFTREKPLVRDRFRRTAVPDDVTGKWGIITVKDDKGRTLGFKVNLLGSDGLLWDAFREELDAAGYTVKLVHKLPKGVAKGIELSRIDVDQEQVPGLLTVDGTCRLQLSVDLWRNGAKLKKIEYASSSSDFAIGNGDRLSEDLMTNVVQDAMKKSIPEIIKAFNN